MEIRIRFFRCAPGFNREGDKLPILGGGLANGSKSDKRI
jgi:hypothetical protein